MQILGFHIISDNSLRRAKQEARDSERCWSNLIISKLLANYENLRKGIIKLNPLEQLQRR